MTKKTFRQFLDELVGDDYKKASITFDDIQKEADNNGNGCIASCLCWIMQEGLLEKTQEVLKSKGQAFEKKHFFENSFGSQPPFLKALDKETTTKSLYKILKANNEEVTPEDLSSDKQFLNKIVQEGYLEKANNFIGQFGHTLNREQIDDRKNNPRGAINIAIQCGKIEEMDRVLQKSNDGITYNDIFTTGKKENKLTLDFTEHETAFNLSVNSTSFSTITDFMTKKGWEVELSALTFEDPVTQGEYHRTPLFVSLLYSGQQDYLIDIMEKNNAFITLEDVAPRGEVKDTPLTNAIRNKTFKRLADHLKKGKTPIPRSILVKNDDSSYGNILGHMVQNDLIEVAQHICKQNNEPPVTIRDIPAKSVAFFNLEKTLGVKGFSDNLKDLKQVWEELPKSIKNERNTEVYQKHLREAIVKTINFQNNGKNR